MLWREYDEKAIKRSNTPMSRYETTMATTTKPTPKARKSTRSNAKAMMKQATTESHIRAERSLSRSRERAGQMPKVKGRSAMHSSMHATRPQRRRGSGALSPKHTSDVVPATTKRTGQNPPMLTPGMRETQ